MRKSADGLKKIEEESKKYLKAEKESTIEEFRKCVFEEVFRKKLGYDCASSLKWSVEQQVYIINDKLKVRYIFDIIVLEKL